VCGNGFVHEFLQAIQARYFKHRGFFRSIRTNVSGRKRSHIIEFEMRLQIYNTSITKELIKSWKNVGELI
jgi:hypothetical protein